MEFPFKVLCVSEGELVDANVPRIKVGEIYTAIDYNEQIIGRTKYCGYILAEFGSNFAYGVYCFIPLSEIDETKMERNYKKEKMYIQYCGRGKR
jgi:hypothetical protein